MSDGKEYGFLWLSSFGFLVNWFGDSLDGTLARIRNQPEFHMGIALKLFDLIAVGVALILFTLYFINFLIEKKKYEKIDPPRSCN